MANEKPLKVTPEEFRENLNTDGGYCENCREFTNMSGVKPDAENIRCDSCNENTVFGAEIALVLGLILIRDDAKPEK